MINQLSSGNIVGGDATNTQKKFHDKLTKSDRVSPDKAQLDHQPNITNVVNDTLNTTIAPKHPPTLSCNQLAKLLQNCRKNHRVPLSASSFDKIDPNQDIPQPEGVNDSDTFDNCSQVQLSRKVFCSHSSILNALANPDLDFNIPDYIPDPFTREGTPLLDPSFSLSSWQDISTAKFSSRYINSPNLSLPISTNLNSPKLSSARNNSPLPPTSLILSNTSDDERDLAVLPSKHSVMVFETDEESELEDLLVDDDDSPTFVMPQMSVTDGSVNFKPFQICILSSNSTSEIIQFVDTLNHDLKFDAFNINHFNLSKKSRGKKSKFRSINTKLIKDADLIFIINDGSKLFLEFLSNIFNDNQNLIPKLTIINMMTVNYFINLFDLINLIKPYQIWKTSSLTSESMILKCEKFINLQFSQLDELNLQYSTMYSSLTVSTRKDYKSIERQFKLDLSESAQYNDPLQISGKFSNLTMIYNILKSLFQSKSDGFENCKEDNVASSKFWLFASFTLGIGLGASFASGAATVLGCYIYQAFGPSEPLPIQNTPTVNVDDWDFMGTYQACLDYIKLASVDLKSILSLYIEYVKGGFQKFFGMMIAIF